MPDPASIRTDHFRSLPLQRTPSVPFPILRSGKQGEEVPRLITNSVRFVKENRAAIVPFVPLREITGMPMRDGRLGLVSRKGAKAQREENHEPRKTSLQTKRSNPEEISALSPLSVTTLGDVISNAEEHEAGRPQHLTQLVDLVN